MIDIQENLKAILKERGFSQKTVAKDLGITEQALSNWFNRKTDLSFNQITRICEVVKVSIVDAITWPDKYVPADQANPACEECKRKDEIIDNLQELLRKYKQERRKNQ